MNKKSALLTASGLAVSFMAGAAAVSFNWGLGVSGASTSAAGAVTTSALKPIVKHRTIVVHRKAPTATAPAQPQTVVLPAPAAASRPAVTTTGGSPTAGAEPGDGADGGADD